MSTVNFYKNITIFSRILSLLHSVLIFPFSRAIINAGHSSKERRHGYGYCFFINRSQHDQRKQ